MNHSSKICSIADAILSAALACVLPMAAHAQTVESNLSSRLPQPAVTLDPPTGSDLQAHSFDGNGNRLPDTPPNFRRLGEARVGEPANIHTLTLRFPQDLTITSIQITRDFRVEKGGSCETGNHYAKGSTCTVLVRFTPRGAGNRLGHLKVGTNVSATPMAFGLGGYGYSPTISFVPSIIATVPGTYPASKGLLSGAFNLAVDGNDTLYVADTGNNNIRFMDSSGNFGSLDATHISPKGITVDTFGEVYFDQVGSNNMFEVYDYGPVVQVNGTGTVACTASTPCNLSSEALSSPGMMSTDGYNHLFFADSHSGMAMVTSQPNPQQIIFLYDPFPYQLSPSGAVVADRSDNLYSLWANGGTCSIIQQSLYNAEISSVNFTKIAGGHTCGFAGDGGQAGNAEIGALIGQMAFDTAGDLYFTDTNNQRVRRIDYNTGVIRTIAGNGTAGYTGDGNNSIAAQLSTPTGVAVDSQGAVYVISSAASGQVIRKVGPNGALNFGSQSKGTSSSSKPIVVTNTGNATMTLTSAVLTGTNASEFKIDNTNTNCVLTPGAGLAAGQTCMISFIFTPSGTGTRQAALKLLDNTVNGADFVTLLGTGTLPTPILKITSPNNGQSFKSGTTVTFAASVTYTSAPQPTGTVQFKVDGANYGSPVTLSSTGTASTSVSGLTQTTHTLSVTYSGDANYAPPGPASISITVTAVIAKPPIIILKPMSGDSGAALRSPRP